MGAEKHYSGAGKEKTMKRVLKKLSRIAGGIFLSALILSLAASPAAAQESGYELGWAIYGGAQGAASGGGFELNGSSGWLIPGSLSGGSYTLSVFPGAIPAAPTLAGDVNGDGRIDVADAILVLRHIVGLLDIGEEYGPEALVRGRVSGPTGGINVGDAILILRYIVGLIPQFPIESQ